MDRTCAIATDGTKSLIDGVQVRLVGSECIRQLGTCARHARQAVPLGYAPLRCETPRSICWLTVIPATLARIIFAYLQSLQVYEQHAWAAGAWRDVFADLVQGQLQQLFLTLLRRIVDASGVHVEARELPLS